MVVCQMSCGGHGEYQAQRRSFGKQPKPWRQRVLAGPEWAPQIPLWRKGGIVFGPHPRSYAYSLPKKVRRLALRSALSSKVISGDLIVLDELNFTQPKTKDMLGVLDNLKVERKALIVTADDNENVNKSARNIPGIKPGSPPV